MLSYGRLTIIFRTDFLHIRELLIHLSPNGRKFPLIEAEIFFVVSTRSVNKLAKTSYLVSANLEKSDFIFNPKHFECRNEEVSIFGKEKLSVRTCDFLN